MSDMRFAIVGCGLIGQKRAAAISRLGHLTILAVDPSRNRAIELAEPFGARSATDFHAAVEAADIDAVVVATPHVELSAIAIACLDAGKHVLVEKPGGRNLAEVSAVADAAATAGRVAKVGYNHRFHPAVLKAREIVDHLKYPPVGHRSVAGAQPQFDYRAMRIGELTGALNAATLTVVMVETPKAIANVEAIAAVPGVDVVLVGTNDLAAEMGIPGDFANPKIAAAYKKIIAACKKHKKFPGMGGVYSDELMQKYVGMGMRMILSGGDVGMLMQAATQRASFLRGCA